MSTLQATNLKHNASASNNIVLDSGGNTAVAGNLSFNSGFGSAGLAYGCRAWVNFNGTGTVAIRGSGNVSSITDLGTGSYTVNIAVAMPDVNYCVVNSTYAQNDANFLKVQTGPTTTTFRLEYSNSAGGNLADPLFVWAAVIR